MNNDFEYLPSTAKLEDCKRTNRYCIFCMYDQFDWDNRSTTTVSLMTGFSVLPSFIQDDIRRLNLTRR